MERHSIAAEHDQQGPVSLVCYPGIGRRLPGETCWKVRSGRDRRRNPSASGRGVICFSNAVPRRGIMHITPQERQALGVTALLLVAGAGVRLYSSPAEDVAWFAEGADSLVEGTLATVREAAAQERERERIRNEPLAPGERIDPNQADALQLDRLPRVGPALAERIVAHREEHGPFRSLADLQAVQGIGPSLLAAVEPLVTLPEVPAITPVTLPLTAVPAAAARASPGAAVNVNRANSEELQALPGIGPALADRIVESRRSEGPF